MAIIISSLHTKRGPSGEAKALQVLLWTLFASWDRKKSSNDSVCHLRLFQPIFSSSANLWRCWTTDHAAVTILTVPSGWNVPSTASVQSCTLLAPAPEMTNGWKSPFHSGQISDGAHRALALTKKNLSQQGFQTQSIFRFFTMLHTYISRVPLLMCMHICRVGFSFCWL